MLKGDFYILENNVPKEVSIDEYREFMMVFENKIVKRSSSDKSLVSTVFLGIPHHNGIFETMIFLDDNFIDVCTDRCWTYDEALEMHEKAVNYAKEQGWI